LAKNSETFDMTKHKAYILLNGQFCMSENISKLGVLSKTFDITLQGFSLFKIGSWAKLKVLLDWIYLTGCMLDTPDLYQYI